MNLIQRLVKETETHVIVRSLLFLLLLLGRRGSVTTSGRGRLGGGGSGSGEGLRVGKVLLGLYLISIILITAVVLIVLDRDRMYDKSE